VTVERGEIYWVDLPEPDEDDDPDITGHEQGYRRPGIVFQSDPDNQSANTTIVVPTTTGSREEAEHINTIYIPEGTGGLDEDSIALCRQIRVVDIDARIDGYIGTLPNDKLREIEAGVEVTLNL